MGNQKHISKLLLLMLPFLVANTPFRPKNITELGLSDAQMAYKIPLELIWVNYKALRRDFPVMRKKTNDEIDAFIRENGGAITRSQKLLEDLFTTPIEPVLDKQGHEKRTVVYHPLQYGRGGVSELSWNGEKILWDLKMTGLGNGSEIFYKHRGSAGTFLRLNAIYLLWKENEPLSIEIAKELQAELDEAQKEFPSYEKKFADPNLSVAEKKSKNRDVRMTKESIQLNTQVLALNNLVSDPKASETEEGIQKQKVLEALRSKDYVNGLAYLERSFKEVVVQQVLQTILDQQFEFSGVREDTIENYFLGTLPFYGLNPHGEKRPLGVIGRQAHWREHTVNFEKSKWLENVNKFSWRSESRGIQADIFGSYVDFELHELIDSRLPFSSDDEALDDLCSEATDRYMQGDKNAFTKFLNKTLEQIKQTKINYHFESNPHDYRKNLFQVLATKLHGPKFKNKSSLLELLKIKQEHQGISSDFQAAAASWAAAHHPKALAHVVQIHYNDLYGHTSLSALFSLLRRSPKDFKAVGASIHKTDQGLGLLSRIIFLVAQEIYAEQGGFILYEKGVLNAFDCIADILEKINPIVFSSSLHGLKNKKDFGPFLSANFLLDPLNSINVWVGYLRSFGWKSVDYDPFLEESSIEAGLNLPWLKDSLAKDITPEVWQSHVSQCEKMLLSLKEADKKKKK